MPTPRRSLLACARDPVLHNLGTYLHLPRIWYTVPEGIMQKSKAEMLRKLASKRQIVRAKDAKELGIPRTYLPRLARRGDLEKVGRGLFSSRDFSGTENTSLIEAARSSVDLSLTFNLILTPLS